MMVFTCFFIVFYSSLDVDQLPYKREIIILVKMVIPVMM